MSAIEWFQLLVVLALASILVFIMVRAHRSAGPPVTPEMLARFQEIQAIARLADTDPQAAEKRATALQLRDKKASADLWSRARYDRSVARRLVRDLQRDLTSLQSLESDIRVDSPEDPVLAEVASDIERVTKSLALARDLLR